jgi:hypothetical protein
VSVGSHPRVGVVIGGVQKGGTTALDSVLRRHPAMRMTRRKELHWFDNDLNFAQAPNYLAYHSFWRNVPGDGLRCDSTPSYLWWPSATERLHAYNPSMRWIVLLRDPAERAYSHWNMVRSLGQEPMPFAQALDAEGARLATAPPLDRLRYSYASRGFYARQLTKLFGMFPREQVLVLRSDRLREDFATTIATVLEFLGLEPLRLDPASANEGNYIVPLAPADRARLVEAYDADIRELERLLGWDLADWRR